MVDGSGFKVYAREIILQLNGLNNTRKNWRMKTIVSILFKQLRDFVKCRPTTEKLTECINLILA